MVKNLLTWSWRLKRCIHRVGKYSMRCENLCRRLACAWVNRGPTVFDFISAGIGAVWLRGSATSMHHSETKGVAGCAPRSPQRPATLPLIQDRFVPQPKTAMNGMSAWFHTRAAHRQLWLGQAWHCPIEKERPHKRAGQDHAHE
jgi:hypothetical protein